jgi:hypothetical protein
LRAPLQPGRRVGRQFLLTEGIIQHKADVLGIVPCPDAKPRKPAAARAESPPT